MSDRQSDQAAQLRAALQNCVDYWPAALNDDLQERTYMQARDLLEQREPPARVTEASGKAPKRLVTHNNVIGQMARWAVRQHPYHRPDGLFELAEMVIAAAQDWEVGPPSCKMAEFPDWQEVEKWLVATLGDDPILKQWNTPRSGHTQQIIGSSRYWGPKAEDDFIDIDAWVRNVARSVWATAGED